MTPADAHMPAATTDAVIAPITGTALAERAAAIRDEIGKAFIGQAEVLDQILIALLAGGHVLIEGVPGLGKTLLVRALSRTLDCGYARVQFTPDLMPSDISGHAVWDPKNETFNIRRGPVFTNLLLADEINRAPAKTQSALLEAMQERRVTVQGRTYVLEPPFFVFATQNPIELEGTYPLPEAQLDRFMFEVILEYLPELEEIEVVKRTTALQSISFSHALTGADIIGFQELVRRVPAADPVVRYAVQLARRSRPGEADAPDFVKRWLLYGASVRAAQSLILGGKARALIHGRYHVSFEDVRALAKPVFRHRLLLNFHAQSERVTTDQVVDRLIESVPVPRSGL
jgi:MoxR-like ATPase